MSRLAYVTRGHGHRPVLLLHGFLGSGRNLASLARRWTEQQPQRLAILPDLTGHGSSPPLPEGASLATLAADVLASARALGLARPYPIVGHSLGGRVALAMLQLDPGELSDVTLLDISPGPVPQAHNSLAPVLDALVAAPAWAPARENVRADLRERGLSEPLIQWLLMNLTAAEGSGVTWRFDRQALAALHASTRDVDLWPVLEQGATTIRCIRGDRSAFVTDADAQRMRQLGCEVLTLAGAGHFLHVDNLEGLLDLLVAHVPL